MLSTIAQLLRCAADWLAPLATPAAPNPEPALLPQVAAELGPQVLIARRTINEMRAAEYLQLALNRYSPKREYRA
jgi:hypothetical protein